MHKGKWHRLFVRSQPIYLELGCGKGAFVASLASQNLDKNFIAVDIKSEVLVLAKRNIEKQYNKFLQPLAKAQTQKTALNIPKTARKI